MNCSVNRWSPVYDFDSLKLQIKELVESGLVGFYNESPNLLEIYQGDIFELKDGMFPYIDEEGNIVAEESNIWLVLGNTCDITRDDLEYTNIIPLEVLTDIPPDIMNDLKKFQNYKKIYYPPYSTDENQGYLVDFTKICTIDKKFLSANGNKICELKFHSWVLFHSCIIRYFARDDGRND